LDENIFRAAGEFAADGKTVKHFGKNAISDDNFSGGSADTQTILIASGLDDHSIISVAEN
jgi:hypothetical protein